MILYHGSNVSVAEIDLGMSNVGKDFGCGFYLTPYEQHALRQAQRKTEMENTGVPTVTRYRFDELALSNGDLNVKVFESYTSDWADFVLMNRQNRSHIQAHSYDIVVGPVANDAVGYQIRRFIGGIITKEQLLEELKYMKESSIQYFFSTDRALKYLTVL